MRQHWTALPPSVVPSRVTPRGPTLALVSQAMHADEGPCSWRDWVSSPSSGLPLGAVLATSGAHQRHAALCHVCWSVQHFMPSRPLFPRNATTQLDFSHPRLLCTALLRLLVSGAHGRGCGRHGCALWASQPTSTRRAGLTPCPMAVSQSHSQ